MKLVLGPALLIVVAGLMAGCGNGDSLKPQDSMAKQLEDAKKANAGKTDTRKNTMRKATDQGTAGAPPPAPDSK